MSADDNTGLTLEVRPSPDGDFYDFGTWYRGAWVVLFRRKSGGLDDDIALAKAEADHAASQPSPVEPFPADTQPQ